MFQNGILYIDFSIDLFLRPIELFVFEWLLLNASKDDGIISISFIKGCLCCKFVQKWHEYIGE